MSLAGGVVEVAGIPGEPGALRALSAQLATLSEGLGTAAGQVAAIEAGQWRGPAASAFEAAVSYQPGKYSSAAADFAEAASAVSVYATALEAAQTVAVTSVVTHAQADQASAAWQAQARATGQPPAGIDPGEVARLQARGLLSGAHEDLARAAQRLVAVLEQAHAGAPKQPGLFHRVLHDVGDVVAFPFEVVKGVGVGAWGMVDGVYQLARMVGTEIDPYAYLFDHRAWEANNTRYSDIYAAVTEHPGRFAETMGKSLVSWDEWGRNPGEALGSLLPTAALAVLTAGGATGARTAEVAVDAGASAATLAERVGVHANVAPSQGRIRAPGYDQMVAGSGSAPEGEAPWFEVTNASANRAGTLVPSSFDLSVAGEDFSVVPNATKHIAEYATSTGAGTMPISSLAGAVKTARDQGLLGPGRNFITVGNWELGIDATDKVIYHAVYRP